MMMKKRMIHWLGLTGILAVLSYYSRSGVLTPKQHYNDHHKQVTFFAEESRMGIKETKSPAFEIAAL